MIPQVGNVCKASTDISKATVSPSAKPPPKFAATSVADPGCLSRITGGSCVPDPRFNTATKEKGEKNLLSNLFFSHKYNKIKII